MIYKYFFVLLSTILAQNVLANTLCQPSDLAVTFRQENASLHVSIVGQKNCVFSYYSPFHQDAPVFIGFKFSSKKGYDSHSVSFPMFRFESDNDVDTNSKKFINFFTEQNQLFSSVILNGTMSSQSYGYPLEAKYYHQTNNIDFTLNLKNYFNQFKSVFEQNNLWGKQDIIFEIKLIQDANLNQSLNYYSQPIFYDLGNRYVNKIQNLFIN